VSAAALLGVHENTVRNRVRRAEELLPRGVTLQRRTELQVALRLVLALGESSGSDVAGDGWRRH
jgi:DNA-binding PucR family transcriptional regulator